MPRKRMIDPEFWSDEEIGSWPYTARLFYIGLWNFADDEGRLKANDRLLRNQIFVYDKRIKMSLLKQKVSLKVQWYVVNGYQYGYIKNFLKYQSISHPTASKLPPPPEFSEPSRSANEELHPNIIQSNIIQGNSMKKPLFDFESLWQIYPLTARHGKKEAIRHFNASVKTDQDWGDIQLALNNYKLSEKVIGGKYIKNASTWFNNWQDWIHIKPRDDSKDVVRYD